MDKSNKTQTTKRTRRNRKPSEATKANRKALCYLSEKAKALLEQIDTFPFDFPFRNCVKVNDVLIGY